MLLLLPCPLCCALSAVLSLFSSCASVASLPILLCSAGCPLSCFFFLRASLFELAFRCLFVLAALGGDSGDPVAVHARPACACEAAGS